MKKIKFGDIGIQRIFLKTIINYFLLNIIILLISYFYLTDLFLYYFDGTKGVPEVVFAAIAIFIGIYLISSIKHLTHKKTNSKIKNTMQIIFDCLSITMIYLIFYLFMHSTVLINTSGQLYEENYLEEESATVVSIKHINSGKVKKIPTVVYYIKTEHETYQLKIKGYTYKKFNVNENGRIINISGTFDFYQKKYFCSQDLMKCYPLFNYK